MEKNTEISARISLMLTTLSVTKNFFAKRLGYDRSQTLYDIINGKSAPSFDFFRRFQLSEYSEIINIDWLLTGRGEKLISKKSLIEQPIKGEVEISKAEDKIHANNSDCLLCKEKDKRIEGLERLIETQAEYVSFLKAKCSALENKPEQSTEDEGKQKGEAA
jgi:hypothetical protein